MNYQVRCAAEVIDLYADFYVNDVAIGRDAEELEADLRRNPHRAGVPLQSGYWVARRGRLAVLYEILDGDLTVRILTAKHCPNRYAFSVGPEFLDQLQIVFESLTSGTVLPEVDELETAIARDPRKAGQHVAGNLYEAKLGRVCIQYHVTEHPPQVTIEGVRVV